MRRGTRGGYLPYSYCATFSLLVSADLGAFSGFVLEALAPRGWFWWAKGIQAAFPRTRQNSAEVLLLFTSPEVKDIRLWDSL